MKKIKKFIGYFIVGVLASGIGFGIIIGAYYLCDFLVRSVPGFNIFTLLYIIAIVEGIGIFSFIGWIIVKSVKEKLR